LETVAAWLDSNLFPNRPSDYFRTAQRRVIIGAAGKTIARKISSAVNDTVD